MMMKVQALVVVVVAAVVALAAGNPAEAPVVAAEGGCGPCPNVTRQHFEARGCSPVQDPAGQNKCCPDHWTCSTYAERGLTETTCVYGDKTYAVGDAVPVKGICRRGCKCTKGLYPKDPAHIECGLVECPEQYQNLKPGCRPTFSSNACCATGMYCGEDLVAPANATRSEATTEVSSTTTEGTPVNANDTIRHTQRHAGLVFESPECFAEGVEYYIGQKMFFREHPCQLCTCTKEFSGAYGAGCSPLHCGMGYRNQQQLMQGCTPLYVQGSCCPADWVCPGSPHVIYNAKHEATGKEDKKTHCTLGNWAVPKGGQLSMYDCHTACSCHTPPFFTCVRYQSCPGAIHAHNAFYSP